VRAPIAEGAGYAWFANHGVGRPTAESLRTGLDWFRHWLDDAAPPHRPVVLVGFSGGATFAGGLVLDDPERYAGLALLCGTLPFSAGLPTSPGRLDELPVFIAQGEHDQVIPRELLDRTWDYVRNSSGASVTARRDPAGHELAPQALAALNSWLLDQLPSAQPAATSGSVNVFEHDIRRGNS